MADQITASGGIFTATTEGDTLIIVSKSTVDFTTTTTTLPAGAFAVDVLTNITTTVTLSGTPANGEVWQITVAGKINGVTIDATDNTLDTNNDHNVTLAEIASALALKISNDPGLADFTATAQGLVLTVVNENGASFSVTFTFTQGSSGAATIGTPITETATAKADLTGAATVGEVWNLTLKNATGTVTLSTHSYMVKSSDTLASIAAALAANINAAAPAEFTAFNEGSTLIIVSRSGSAFSLVHSVAAVGTVQTGIATSATRTTTNLSGATPVEHETWQVLLTTREVTPTTTQTINRTISHTVTNGETLADVVAELAAAINADPSADFVATASSNQLVIYNRTGQSFTTSFQILPAGGAAIDATVASTTTVGFNGAPVAGEKWILSLLLPAIAPVNSIASGLTTSSKMTLTGAPHVGDLWTVLLTVNGSTQKFSYTVDDKPALDLLADIAAGLAAIITANPPAGFTAVAIGADLTITNSAGKAFTTSLERISLHSRIVAASDQLADIAHALAAAINADANLGDFSATTEGATLIIVKRTSGAFTTGFAITPANDYMANAAKASAIGFTGTPATDEVWTVNIDGVTVAATVGQTYNAVVVDSLPEIAAALAYQINQSVNLADFTAMAEGSTLIVVNQLGAAFTTSFQITPASGFTIDTKNVAAKAAAVSELPAAGTTWTLDLSVTIVPPTSATRTGLTTSATATLTGTAVLDEVWKALITLDGVTTAFSYTVVNGNTLNSVAAALAAQIDATADFMATSNGADFQVVNPAGKAFTLAVERSSANLTVSVVPLTNAVKATRATATLTGEAVAAEVWNASVVVDGVTTTFSYTVISGNTLVSVAAALATQIDATADFVATSNGADFQVVNPAGKAFTLAVERSSARSRVVASGETLQGVVRALLDLDQAKTDFTVTSDGNSVVAPTNSTSTGLTSAVTTTLTGAVIVGELWQARILLDGVTSTFSHTVASGATLDTVASALAAAIDATQEFDATSNGAKLEVVNGAGKAFSLAVDRNAVALIKRTAGAFTASFTITPAGAGVVDSSIAKAITIRLSGTPKTRELWAVTVDGGTPTTIGHTVVAGDTLASIAAALAAGINSANELADFTATVDGTTLVLVKRTTGAFAAAFKITPALENTGGLAVVDEASGSSATVNLAGKPVTGETWRVTLKVGAVSTSFSHTVMPDESLEDIAAALVTVINSSADAADFTATREGDNLVITKRSSGNFTTSFAILPPTASAFAAGQTATARAVTLSGAVVAGEIWVVSLDFGAAFYIHFVTVERSLADIAGALAAQINADATAYSAMTEGTSLIVVKLTGGPFTMAVGRFNSSIGFVSVFSGTAVTVQTAILSGTPIVGDSWTATVDGQAQSVEVGETIDSVVVDTPAEIAQALADKINSDPSLSDLTAAVKTGITTTLIIVNRTGGALTNSFTVTPVATFQLVPNTPSIASAKTATLFGVPAAGDQWTVVLNSAALTTYTHTVAAGETLADIAAALATSINADNTNAAGYTATSEGATLVVVKRTADSLTMAFSFTPSGGSAAMLTTIDAKVTLATVNGTVIAGRTWTVVLTADGNTSQHNYKTVAGDTTTDIAKALAANINNNAAADFTATSEGATLIIVNRNGTTFTLANPDAIIQAAKTTLVGLFTTPVAGEVWTALLDDGQIRSVHSHTVLAGETLADVALALAKEINRTAAGAFHGDDRRRHADYRQSQWAGFPHGGGSDAGGQHLDHRNAQIQTAAAGQRILLQPG